MVQQDPTCVCMYIKTNTDVAAASAAHQNQTVSDIKHTFIINCCACSGALARLLTGMSDLTGTNDDTKEHKKSRTEHCSYQLIDQLIPAALRWRDR